MLVGWLGMMLLQTRTMAAVIYQQYPRPLGVNALGKTGNLSGYIIEGTLYQFTWAKTPHDFDFDGNGTVDLTIGGNWRTSVTDSIFVTQHGRNAVWSVAGGVAGNDFGSHALALAGGTELGPSLHSEEPRTGWHNEDDTRGFSVLMEGMSGTPVSGTFFPDSLFQQKYLGFRFERDGALHYGWMALSGYAFYGNEIYVYSWAYESQPDTALIVGQVPEPSAAGLLCLGFWWMTGRRRRC